MASLQYVRHNKRVKARPKKEHSHNHSHNPNHNHNTGTGTGTGTGTNKPHKRLSPTVIKKLEDIDSGRVKMITQTADEFIADMKKELATSKTES
jgi:hypothetical protein